MKEIELFKLFGTILINNEEAMKSLSSTEKKFEEIGEKFSKVGKNLTTKVTLPIVGIGAAAAKIGMDFEQSMSKVKAMSGATGEQMERLEKAARDAGAATSKSAKDAADGLTFMALAGWDVETSIAGLMPVLRLSEAGSIDLARASSLVTDSMSAMGIEVDELEGYLDIVAQTARSSNTDIDQMAEAYLGAGGILRGLKVPLDESALALGFLANAGIKGSEAGNSLSAIMTNLTAPTGRAKKALEELGFTAFDSGGNFKGLENVLFELKDKTKDMTDEQRNMYLSMIGGKEHITGLNALMNGLDDSYDSLKESISQADGALNEIAETMMDNNKGSLIALGSALEELALKIYDILSPSIAILIEKIQGVVDWLNNLSPEMQETIVKVALVVAAIGPAILVFGKLLKGISDVIGVVKLLMPVLSALTGPIGLVVVAVTALIAIIVYLWKTNEEFRDNVKKLWEELQKFFQGTLEGIQKLIEGFIKIAKELWDKYGEDIKRITDTVWKTITTIIDTTIKVIQNIIKTITGLISGDWGTTWEGIKGIFTSIWEGMKNLLPNLLEGIYSVMRLSFDVFKNIGEGMFDMVWEGMKGIWTSISNWVSDKVSWLTDKLAFWRKGSDEMDTTNAGSGRRINSSNRTGLAYVPYDGYVAELHKGERVLTAEENKNNNNQGSDIYQTINIYSPTSLTPSETARQIKNVSRELAMEV
ncbi:phage tail tape measure protein [Tissierella sp.]|uniref:phage tail tape measure protein n=1 Tax=Tissierella sp. TaxID=41274 RepID=UPI0030204513